MDRAAIVESSADDRLAIVERQIRALMAERDALLLLASRPGARLNGEIVEYLREHGATHYRELAAKFELDAPALLTRLHRLIGVRQTGRLTGIWEVVA